MSQGLYVVTGATGHVGSEVARGLVRRGKKVRAVARTAEKLKALAGAEAFAASLEDAAALRKAFEGATAAFVMIPPNYGAPDFRAYQRKVTENFAAALESAGVTHAVTLSSVGAHLPAGTGPIAGLHEMEERLNRTRLHVVHLRPAFFMENHLMNLGLIKAQGINGTPMKAGLPVPMIATRDIAAAAVELLAGLSFTGKQARELLGPRDVTMGEVTRVLGAAVGKPDLKYVEFPYADAEKAMRQMGLTADMAGLYVEMYRGFNDGLVRPEKKRSAESTTPTAIEEFAKVFAAAYRSAN